MSTEAEDAKILDSSAGRSTPPKIEFVLTGFGQFSNVGQNPTETLVQELPAYAKGKLPANASIVAASALEVSIEGVLSYLVMTRPDGTLIGPAADFSNAVKNGSEFTIYSDQNGKSTSASESDSKAKPGAVAKLVRPLKQILPDAQDPEYQKDRILPARPADTHRIYIHMGLHGAHDIAVESRAWNSANFRVPDVAGNQPRNKRADATYLDKNGKVVEILYTSLPLEAAVKTLSRSYPTRLGTDPGEYICNFTFFHALRNALHDTVGLPSTPIAERDPCDHALFVHMPMFSYVTKQKQLECMMALMSLLANPPAPASTSDPTSTSSPLSDPIAAAQSNSSKEAPTATTDKSPAVSVKDNEAHTITTTSYQGVEDAHVMR